MNRAEELREFAKVEELVDAIKPLLHGKGSPCQGAALCELLGYWLAGHPDFMRENLLVMHIAAVKDFVPVAEGELFGPGGHPMNKGEEAANAN